ncbi:MAG: diguanylate cyclase [Chloroflexi bacterium]|nr:diguanylate cyclase [Chloroflexota bacterium]
MNRQTRQLRDEAMERIGIGMLAVDGDGVVVDANPAMRQIFGDSSTGSGKLVGQSLSAVLQQWDGLLDAVKDGLETRMEVASGDAPRVRYFAVHIVPVEAQLVVARHVLLLFHEISEYKQAEMQLQMAQESLILQLAEIEDLQIQLREQAIRDPLTGLYNRRYMQDRLPEEILWAQAENKPVCLAMLDIDHFKKINDAYGHKAGDLLLQALSALLCQSVRAEDIVSRYGGEEFMLALPGIDLGLAGRRAEEWRAAVEAMRLWVEDTEIGVTISIGLAAVHPGREDYEQTLRKADDALYQAKRSGRNCVILNRETNDL